MMLPRAVRSIYNLMLSTMNSVTDGRPPSLSNAAVAKLVMDFFPFKTVDELSVKQFPAYDDRNFYFCGTLEETPTWERSATCAADTDPKAAECFEKEYVLKLGNPMFASYEVLKGTNALLNHLHANGFSRCIRPLVSRPGPDVLVIAREKLREYDSTLELPKKILEPNVHLRVVTFIPGECFDEVDKQYLTPRLLYDLGHCMGSVNAIMQDFHHPGLETRTLPLWNLSHFLSLRELLPQHDDKKQKEMITCVLDSFEKYICPKMPNFKKGVIYGDANGLNFIIQKDNHGDYQMAGVIDFGDCISSCYVFDIGILLAYVMTENLVPKNDMSPIEFVGPILRGYTDAFPLSKEEMDCLYYIAMARCCQSGLNGMLTFKQEPWNTYLLNTPSKCWRVIELMLGTSKEEVDRIWANALTTQNGVN